MRDRNPVGSQTGVQRRSLLAWPALILATGCTGVAQTRQARAPERPRLAHLTVRVDTDLIGAAFASYKASAPFESKGADWQGFVDHLLAACRAEMQASGITGTVELISPKAGRAPPSQTPAVLILRATAWLRRQTAVGSHDLGWNGASTWEASLVERDGTEPFKRTWSAVIDSENLNPALCGNYSGCSRAMAKRIFDQLRRDGVSA